MPTEQLAVGGAGKADGLTPDIDAGEKSNACVVPMNDPNNDTASKSASAEDREGRRAAKRNAEQSPAPQTQSRSRASKGLDGVREAACAQKASGKNVQFTALMHHITPLLRLIRKWLTAGVIENGAKTEIRVGTPQGAVISPLLANIYLHYVFDLWFQRWRRRDAKGDVIVVRYADDSVVGFEAEADASRFAKALKARFAQFGLSLNEQKTRVLQFGRYAASQRKRAGLGRPQTFDLLGFTHICATKRSNGGLIVKRLTSSKRMRATLKALRQALYRRRHEPIAVVGTWLRRVMQG